MKQKPIRRHGSVKRTVAKSRKRIRDGDAPAWEDLPKKRSAYLEVMREVVQNPGLGQKYLKSDEEARKAFEKHGMPIPAGVKVVFFRAGDSEPLGSGSAVIELPQPGSDPSDDDLLDLFLCTYTIAW